VGSGVETWPVLLAFAAALLGAKLFGELAERLHQPAVLGELVAGLLLGPSLLGLVTPTAGILLLAQIGILLLLFEVGLETDLADLVRVGGVSTAVSLTGMALSFAGGAAFARALSYGWLPAIFAGAAVATTSIGVSARLLAELGAAKTREGRIILGAAVIDDVLGLIVLAVVSRAAESGGVEIMPILKAAALAIGFLLLALAVGIPLGKRLIHAVGRASVRGVLVAASVGFALFVAVAARKAGSAEIVGAFAAGLVLARTNRQHDIDQALKPVVDIFAPLFFISVGAQVDVSLLNPFAPGNRSAVGLGLGLTAIGFLGKFAAGFCARGPGRRSFIGAGLVPRGEVSLIFAAIGKSTGALSGEIFVAVVYTVFATTFLAPPLMRVLRPATGPA